MKIKYNPLLWALLFFAISSTAQENYTEVDKPIADVRFTNIKYANFKQLSLSEFKGKWVVLDFFTTGCAACFNAMPEMNQFRKDYRGKIEFLYVGLDERNLPNIYDRYRTRLKLDLPVTFIDRNLWSKFDIYGVPHVVIIDNKGVIRCIIPGGVTKDILNTFLAGGTPKLSKKQSLTEAEKEVVNFDSQKPLLVNNNGGPDSVFLFRSLLAKWNGQVIMIPPFMGNQTWDTKLKKPIPGHSSEYRFDAAAMTLKRLYYCAYGDTIMSYPDFNTEVPDSYEYFWPTPILEMRDSSNFSDDWNERKGYYSYSLTVPKEKGSAKYQQKIMQSDLRNYFEYDVTVEERLMPVWKLTATASAKSKLKVENKFIDKTPGNRTDIRIVNKNIKSLVGKLYHTAFNSDIPIIDETGIEGNIYIYVEAIHTVEDLIKGLKKNGLEMTRSTKLMKVIVIRDPKPEPSSK